MFPRYDFLKLSGLCGLTNTRDMGIRNPRGQNLCYFESVSADENGENAAVASKGGLEDEPPRDNWS